MIFRTLEKIIQTYWNSGKAIIVLGPQTFLKNYPESSFKVINRDNFYEFLKTYNQ
jgi:hypothetical protein